MIKLSKIKLNPSNPRTIKDERFEKLCSSLKTFAEKMMPLRPIVIDEDGIILGGNMRFKALKELGFKEVPDDWVKQVFDLSEDEKKEFIVKDNVGFGDWDWEQLETEWDKEQLEEWGLDLPNFESEGVQDYSNKNKEINTGDFSDKMTIKLEFVVEEYHQVKAAFENIGGTPEQIIWNLLGLDEPAL